MGDLRRDRRLCQSVENANFASRSNGGLCIGGSDLASCQMATINEGRLKPRLCRLQVNRKGESQESRDFDYRSATNSASFQRFGSMVQHTLVLFPCWRAVDHAALFRPSEATFRRSTTVMPRVSSLLVSTST